jgi:hypothetical protein
MKLEFSAPTNAQIYNFVKVYPVGAELFHVDGLTGRHDEANSRFFQFMRMRLNFFLIK